MMLWVDNIEYRVFLEVVFDSHVHLDIMGYLPILWFSSVKCIQGYRVF